MAHRWGLSRQGLSAFTSEEKEGGRRERPMHLMSCAMCNRLMQTFGSPPLTPTSLETQRQQQGEWYRRIDPRRPTWHARYTAMVDLHPFGMWLGRYARSRNLSHAQVYDAVFDLTSTPRAAERTRTDGSVTRYCRAAERTH
jgi:hypothetical protein